MTITKYELILYLSLVVLLIYLLWIVSKKLRRKLSKWDELAVSFPFTGIFPESEFFRHCTGKVGTVLFNRRNGELSVGFETSGIIISANKKGWPYLCVPWNCIRSASKYFFRSNDVAKIVIDHKIPLIFYLSDKTLEIFETWHRVETKSLEQLINDR
ncbi:hypothetical protein JXQ31_04465 [candidate division KSB1 bacterium]|nr:hypothetical protein [candidate division KSB1 bacterium]